MSTQCPVPLSKLPPPTIKKNDFSRQRELCSEICDFLLETSYHQSLTVKDLMSVSTANYFMIFSHLSGILLGPKQDLKSGAREEIMISTMKKLDYPFRSVFNSLSFYRSQSVDTPLIRTISMIENQK